MLNKKYIKLTRLLLVTVFTVSSLGFVSYQTTNIYEINKNLDIFGELFKVVNTLYVDDTDPEQLIRTGIDAMLNSLDPYTTFISEEEAENVSFMSTGEYGGIGALVGKRGDRILIIEPYQGAPADMAGIKAGDEIVSVNQTSTTDLEIPDVRDLLRGKEGTIVSVSVLRNGRQESFQVRRDQVKIDNVPYYGMIDSQIGFIQLSGFTENAGKEVREALSMLKQQAELEGLILDLRDNPGGRLDEAVNVANVFLPQREVIVETRGREENTRTLHIARQKPLDIRIPLIVLINEGSASASEIVAGAIQDLDRGIIVGEKSFGKGLVQNIRPLSYNTQLKITTAKYYTPSGRCIQSLDYTQRDANGLASRIPDSLQRVFSTQKGRKVKDGGGIYPDIYLEDGEQDPILRTIISQGLIFDFATDYVGKHDNIPAPRDFHVDNNMYEAFKTYVGNRDISFQTPLDLQLDKLKEHLQEDGIYNNLEGKVEEIESFINIQKQISLDSLQDEIAPLLESEIAKRYYYSEGTIEVAFDDDKNILKALEILRDTDTYQTILTPEYQSSGR